MIGCWVISHSFCLKALLEYEVVIMRPSTLTPKPIFAGLVFVRTLQGQDQPQHLGQTQGQAKWLLGPFRVWGFGFLGLGLGGLVV